MSNWFETAPILQEQGAQVKGDPAETPAPEASEPVAPEAGGEPVVTPEIEPQEPAVPSETSQEPTPDTAPEPVVQKVSLTDLLTEHEDSVAQYLELKRTDFQAMSPEKVLERKLRNDHPEWTAEEIQGELKDKYGLGLQKVEINEYEMSQEEIRDAKEINKLVERGERLMKSDARSAREYFENIKNEAKLPEIELPNTLPSEEEYTATLQKQLAEQRNAWIQQIDGASQGVTNIQRTIEVDDGENGKVALNIDYKLSDTQKQQVSEYLYDYMAHPRDVEKYVKADGTPDLVRFMADKAILNEDILNSMFRSVAKEAMAVARKSVIKKELLNHDDGIQNRPVVTPEGNAVTDAQSKAWGRRR